jgi:hypothetical protein
MYWANMPAANTIEKQVKYLQKIGHYNPLNYFIIAKDDERKVATSFDDWKKDFHEFQNFSRLNMVLANSSCFEVYLRSIVSLSLESRPGVILGDKEYTDGARLLKTNPKYRSHKKEEYLFNSQIDSVVRGEWSNRAIGYKNLFESIPIELENNISELDKFRKLRNDIAHYLARPKDKYELPLIFNPEPILRIANIKLLKYLKIIFDVAQAIDLHLYRQYIGSYEIIVCYYENMYDIYKSKLPVGEKAKRLQKMIGAETGMTVGTQYYKDLVKYFEAL